MVKGKQKTTVFFTPSVRGKIEDTYRSDNCKSQSEFIEKAVEFYLGYLNTKNAGAFLRKQQAEKKPHSGRNTSGVWLLYQHLT